MEFLVKKLIRFQPELITEKFFKGIHPSAINKGRCFKWAYLTHRVFDKTELWSHGSHAFIKYGRKFYDSEAPKGVYDWKDLPATNNGRGCGCRRCALPAKRMYVPIFKYNWRGMQQRFNVEWDELDLQALEFIKNG